MSLSIKILKAIRILLAVASLNLFSGVSPASAFFTELVGVNDTVRLAGNEFRESIEAAKSAAEELIARGDQAAKARLEQLNTIQTEMFEQANELVELTESKALSIINEASGRVNKLRVDLFKDLDATLWKAECGAKRILLSDVKDALGGLGEFLGTSQIKLTAPIEFDDSLLCRTLNRCTSTKKFRIKEPFDRTYIEVRDFMLANIDGISDENPAHRIVATYEYIGAFALKTTCFFPNGSSAYNKEYLEYTERAKLWRNLLNVEPK